MVDLLMQDSALSPTIEPSPAQLITEITKLIDEENYPLAKKQLKKQLQLAHSVTNRNQDLDIKYQLFALLGDIYLAEASQEKLANYPKAMGLYQYSKLLISQLTAKQSDFEPVINVDQKINDLWQKFLKSINQNHQAPNASNDQQLTNNLDFIKQIIEYKQSQYNQQLDESRDLVRESLLKVESSKTSQTEDLELQATQISEIYNHIGEFFIKQTGLYKDQLDKFRDLVRESVKEDPEINQTEDLELRTKQISAIYNHIGKFFVKQTNNQEAAIINTDQIIEQNNQFEIDNINQIFANQQPGWLNKIIDDCFGLMPLPEVTIGDETRAVNYAFYSLGSLALGTTTPYSDLEWGILIEQGMNDDDSRRVKEYFKQFSTLLNLKIIALGETILPSLTIEELNDFSNKEDEWFYDLLTPRGFCFDGAMPGACKTPLGRQGYQQSITKEDGQSVIKYPNFSLISTVNQLLEFQAEPKQADSQEIDWYQQEPHLVQSLWHTTLIHGDNQLLKQYHEGLKLYLNSIKTRADKLLLKDLKAYDPYQVIDNSHRRGTMLDVKKEIYRFSDRIIASLGAKCGITNLSNEQVIKQLANNKTINQSAANNLNIALNIAKEIRLQAYLANNSQRDKLATLSEHEIVTQGSHEQNIFYIKDLNLIYRYYYTTFALALVLERPLNSDDLLADDNLSKACIAERFNQKQRAIDLLEIEINQRSQNILIEENYALHKKLANLYFEQEEYEKSFILYKEIRENQITNNINDYIDFAEISLALGNASIKMKQLKEAKSYFQEGLNYLTHDSEVHASLLNSMGVLNIKLNEQAEGLNNLKNSLDMRLRLSKRNPLLEYRVADSYDELSNYTDDYQQRLKYNQQGLEIRQKIYKTANLELARSYSNQANIYQMMNEHQESLDNANKSLIIYQQLPIKYDDILNCFISMTQSNIELKQYQAAEKSIEDYFINLKELAKSVYPDQFILIDQLNDWTNYQQLLTSQDSFELIIKLIERYPSILEVCYLFGLIQQQNYQQYNKAIEIYKWISGIIDELGAASLNPENVIALLHNVTNSLAVCDYNIKNYEQANQYAELAFNLSSPNDKTLHIAKYNNLINSYDKLFTISADIEEKQQYLMKCIEWRISKIQYQLEQQDQINNAQAAYTYQARYYNLPTNLRQSNDLMQAKQYFEIARAQQPTSGLLVEYANFLLNCYNLKQNQPLIAQNSLLGDDLMKQIRELLFDALLEANPSEDLTYNLIETACHDRHLQKLINEQQKIKLGSKFYACYLLITHAQILGLDDLEQEAYDSLKSLARAKNSAEQHLLQVVKQPVELPQIQQLPEQGSNQLPSNQTVSSLMDDQSNQQSSADQASSISNSNQFNDNRAEPHLLQVINQPVEPPQIQQLTEQGSNQLPSNQTVSSLTDDQLNEQSSADQASSISNSNQPDENSAEQYLLQIVKQPVEPPQIQQLTEQGSNQLPSNPAVSSLIDDQSNEQSSADQDVANSSSLTNSQVEPSQSQPPDHHLTHVERLEKQKQTARINSTIKQLNAEEQTFIKKEQTRRQQKDQQHGKQ